MVRSRNNDLIFKTHEGVLRLEGKVDSIIAQVGVINNRLNSHDEKIDVLEKFCTATTVNNEHMEKKLADIEDESKKTSVTISGIISTIISALVAAIMTVIRWLGG